MTINQIKIAHFLLSSFSFLHKLLIATRSGVGEFARSTEVIDVENPDSKCEPLPDFPIGTMPWEAMGLYWKIRTH